MRDCGDCAVKPGEYHQPGCDVERCPLCGRQMLSDRCVYRVNGLNVETMSETHPELYNEGPTEEMWEKYDAVVDTMGGRLRWTGEWPGRAECIEFNLYCRWVSRKTFQPIQFSLEEPGFWMICAKEDEGADVDLNSLFKLAFWCKNRRKWVLNETA